MAANAVGVAEDISELSGELDGPRRIDLLVKILGLSLEDAVWLGLGILRV